MSRLSVRFVQLGLALTVSLNVPIATVDTALNRISSSYAVEAKDVGDQLAEMC